MKAAITAAMIVAMIAAMAIHSLRGFPDECAIAVHTLCLVMAETDSETKLQNARDEVQQIRSCGCEAREERMMGEK